MIASNWTNLRATLIRTLLVLLALPVFWMAGTQEAQANVGCGVNSHSMNFGTANTGTGTVNFTCTNYNNYAVSFTICLKAGTPSYPGTTSQPKLQNGGSELNYNLYTDAATTQVMTGNTVVTKSVNIASGIGQTTSGTLQFYGKIPTGQSSPAGNYTGYMYNVILGFIPSGGGTCSDNIPANGGTSGAQFTLQINATVSNNCTVTAGANAVLGQYAPSASPVSGSTSISVHCPSGTGYTIGLKPSNNSTIGLGAMSGTGGNTAQVVYQLRKTSTSGPVWGNTASVGNTGNGVSGTGNGSNQNYPVYVTLPNTNYPADSYSDTVLVTVHY